MIENKVLPIKITFKKYLETQKTSIKYFKFSN